MKTFDDFLNEGKADKYSANIGREGKTVINAVGKELSNTVVINVSENDITYIEKVKSDVFELHTNSNHFGSSKQQTIALDKKSIEMLSKAISKL